MSNVSNKDFEDHDEPSVLSADPNERKLARRLRIQKRIEALQKLDGDENAEEIQEESITQKQIAASAELLEKIIAEGNEVITNIRVANDARELDRRKEASNTREQLLKLLEDNAYECQKRYDIINAQWSAILESNDPLDINSDMESQRKQCDEVLSKKDSVIAALKKELEIADNKYFDDQNKQKDDMRLLIERIENQMSTMENIYDRELDLIEKTLKTERDALVSSFQKKWDTLYKQQEDEDTAGDEKRNEIMREYEEEMEKVMRDHDEEFRIQKIELEKECQTMQQQVEKTKALCMLNTEKLSYNYIVLKSREEENSIVKSQQKRKINKLQSSLNHLKKTYSDLQESTKVEIDKLSNQILKAHNSIKELEEKSLHFTSANEKQYMDIWNMNTEKVNALMKKILLADRMIHERSLGIIWEDQKESFLKKEDLLSYRTAMALIERQKKDESENLMSIKYKEVEESFSEMKLRRQVLSNILKEISNCSGYLIEDKLQELISRRSEEEKTIIRLDNVFQALSISSTEEIDMLLHFFLPYAYCSICSKKQEESDSVECLNSSSVSSTSSCASICDGCTDENVKQLINSVKEEIASVDRYENHETMSSSSDRDIREVSMLEDENKSDDKTLDLHKYKKYVCNKGHVLEIQAAYVTKAMKEVLSGCNAEDQQLLPPFDTSKEKFTISRNLSTDDVRYYWSSYRKIFNVQKERLWDAVLIGLNKYYEILKERHQLCNETNNLRKQNAELQRLLESHNMNPEDGLSLLQVKSSKHTFYK